MKRRQPLTTLKFLEFRGMFLFADDFGKTSEDTSSAYTNKHPLCGHVCNCLRSTGYGHFHQEKGGKIKTIKQFLC